MLHPVFSALPTMYEPAILEADSTRVLPLRLTANAVKHTTKFKPELSKQFLLSTIQPFLNQFVV